jgi:16S rRNA (cytidine1402-2'-O)-methyltransferase
MGTLYIIATPIGNLDDFSQRAVETLKAVDVIASEDTRIARQLLGKFGIQVPLISFFEHNEDKRIPELIRHLETGEAVALISDAGTPLISDPGYRLVREAATRDIRIVPVPGPSAVMAALSVSGLPTDRFTFVGFLPRKASKRKKELQKLTELTHTVVIFESPYRLLKTLQDMAEIMGDRQVVVCRELTKKFEEILRGIPAELLKILSDRTIMGEITLVVAGKMKG